MTELDPWLAEHVRVDWRGHGWHGLVGQAVDTRGGRGMLLVLLDSKALYGSFQPERLLRVRRVVTWVDV